MADKNILTDISLVVISGSQAKEKSLEFDINEGNNYLFDLPNSAWTDKSIVMIAEQIRAVNPRAKLFFLISDIQKASLTPLIRKFSPRFTQSKERLITSLTRIPIINGAQEDLDDDLVVPDVVQLDSTEQVQTLLFDSDTKGF